MATTNDSMMNPRIEELLDRVDSKFSLVTLAAYCARQINAYFNQLGDGLGTLIPPQVSSLARKPLSIAFEEIAADKIVKVSLPDFDELEAEAAQAFGDAEVVAVEEADYVAEMESVAEVIATVPVEVELAETEPAPSEPGE